MRLILAVSLCLELVLKIEITGSKIHVFVVWMSLSQYEIFAVCFILNH